ncbi:hypothetical protein F4781DRAFT_414790 [Annulohypoxylon bovei var. microspora]|nr:hypothetical protein F4781DRAFT_414790 [Annulohypoxylon bovei var. microspora]
MANFRDQTMNTTNGGRARPYNAPPEDYVQDFDFFNSPRDTIGQYSASPRSRMAAPSNPYAHMTPLAPQAQAQLTQPQFTQPQFMQPQFMQPQFTQSRFAPPQPTPPPPPTTGPQWTPHVPTFGFPHSAVSGLSGPSGFAHNLATAFVPSHQTMPMSNNIQLSAQQHIYHEAPVNAYHQGQQSSKRVKKNVAPPPRPNKTPQPPQQQEAPPSLPYGLDKIWAENRRMSAEAKRIEAEKKEQEAEREAQNQPAQMARPVVRAAPSPAKPAKSTRQTNPESQGAIHVGTTNQQQSIVDVYAVKKQRGQTIEFKAAPCGSTLDQIHEGDVIRFEKIRLNVYFENMNKSQVGIWVIQLLTTVPGRNDEIIRWS